MSEPSDVVLAAFREVTGWTDEQVIHYMSCVACIPICGHEEEDCGELRAIMGLAITHAARTDPGEEATHE